MPTVAVNVAVIHEGRILLTKRNDFHVWCIPGGGVEEGESVADAAIRETKEETGLDVELTRLVGVYSRLGGIPEVNVHAILYEAKPIGGELKIQPGETLEARYFLSTELPQEMFFGHIRRIADAMDGVHGISVRQKTKFAGEPAFSRKEIFDLMEQSGLSPQEFYMQRIKSAEINEVVEVGGV